MSMSTRLRLSLALLTTLVLSACDDAPRFTHAEPGEALSGGSATVRKSDQNAFSMPSANLAPVRRLDFSVGNSFFRSPWVIAPSTTTARDGLGPLFNTNACQNCHIKDGRGHPPEAGDSNAVSMLVRLSIPDDPAYADLIKRNGVLPEPVYGGQLQDMSNPGVAPEGKVRVEYDALTVEFRDGTPRQSSCASRPSGSPSWAMAPCTPILTSRLAWHRR
ncbi:putative thiol oxidoreductase with 2 cytochrome c heme-binding site [Pseudomonas syringae pv. aptata]|uniref:Putative thiol oxidoreductase with 2 cytochrome c heme-binding site n=1 Tax=Pseudomonas syringae pv. aptata TaxID=83167 RepID=A0A3M5WB54_PSEAP|nr:putative thiol oxidoreductase with 2 cytochrome c heme-binding site [Pseudomonas syringae pv. aptata]